MPWLTNEQPRHTVLVVDDQPINIQVLYHALSGDNRVLKATSGTEALRICRTGGPDLVLLDVVMPGMDGLEVCRQLKADPATRGIPIIFVTAQNESSQETLGLELGAVDFIIKPVNPPVVRARVNTHLALARSGSLLAATQEASADGILVIDLAGRISSMNRTFARMWNVTNDLIGETSSRLVFEFMRGRLRHPERQGHHFVDVLVRSGSLDGDSTLELVDDRALECIATPLQINGSARGQVLTFRDVTDRRRATEALRILNESLEFRINERTQALEHATRLAEAANHAKSDFLSNMSHEIRTPINAVIGLAYLALKAESPSKQRDFLGKIHGAGQHLLGIVNNILDFSKIEARKLDLEEIDFDLSTVFDSVSSQSADAANAKGLSLEFAMDPSVSGPLCGDPLRLGQVLLNYVSNALKFTPHGAVTVRATMLHRFEADDLIRCEVEDTGIGLSEAQLSEIFRPFHQVDASTTRRYGGTGLGLVVCKQLVELMGGEVGALSQPGQGSTFWFTARVRPGTSRSADRAAVTGMLSNEYARRVIRGAHLLLVEDNLLNQTVAAGLLAEAGATVRVAANGQEALDRLRVERFDCVLMDVQMPVMDGIQATRLIRANPLLAGLPVLAMTANAGSEERARCAAAGMDDFMSKPVLPERLFAILAGWLTARPGAFAQQPTVTRVLGPLPAVPVGDPNVIDLSILSRSVGDDAQKVRRYADLFIGSMRESIAEIEGALGHEDLSTLADLGHRLKSSSAMVGAIGLARLCESLERCRTGATIDQARGIVTRLPILLGDITAAVEAAFS